MENGQPFHIQLETDLPFDQAIERITAQLKNYGFGIITEIDVTKTLKVKLGEDFAPYHILGACNPSFAHKALLADPRIGVFLPCNVCVWDRGDRRVLMAMEPEMMVSVVDNPKLTQISHDLSCLLHRALDAFSQTNI